MSRPIQNVVKSLLDGMHTISHSETVVGEPSKVGEATIVPVHRLRVGFFAGTVAADAHASEREGETGSRGVAGTAQVDPVAVLAVGPDGKPRLLAVDGDNEGTWQQLMRDTPELISRALNKLADRWDLGEPEKGEHPSSSGKLRPRGK